MFVSDQSLPHLLKPEDYSSVEQHECEQLLLREHAWHCVATHDQLAQPGCFISGEIAGVAYQVRNVEGRLAAFSNVCSHRHCLLTDTRQGCSEQIRCQYHGWQYDDEGYTRGIPEPKNFQPFDREALRLPTYRAQACGQLVFICFSEVAGSLEEFLGEYHGFCEERFGKAWRPFLSWDPAMPVNWKIPVENSLESYHVPAVHSQTFREDPGESRSQHELTPCLTSMRTQLPFSPHSKPDAWFQRREDRLVRWFGNEPSGEYRQVHIFPNLMFSFTDAISLVHSVVPTGPTTSRAVVRQFGLVGESSGPMRRGCAIGWGKLKALITKRVLQEDLALFPSIQEGLAATTRQGILGRCEERIHEFQHYLVEAMAKDGCQDAPTEIPFSSTTVGR